VSARQTAPAATQTDPLPEVRPPSLSRTDSAANGLREMPALPMSTFSPRSPSDDPSTPAFLFPAGGFTPNPATATGATGDHRRRLSDIQQFTNKWAADRRGSSISSVETSPNVPDVCDGGFTPFQLPSWAINKDDVSELSSSETRSERVGSKASEDHTSRKASLLTPESTPRRKSVQFAEAVMFRELSAHDEAAEAKEEESGFDW